MNSTYNTHLLNADLPNDYTMGKINKSFSGHYFTNQQLVKGVTFTLNPDYTKSKRFMNQFNTTFPKICELLYNYSNGVYLVCAELTKQANIHFHAIVQFDNPCNEMLLYDILKTSKYKKYFGFFKTEHFQHSGNLERWIKYITKDVEYLSGFLTKRAPEKMKSYCYNLSLKSDEDVKQIGLPICLTNLLDTNLMDNTMVINNINTRITTESDINKIVLKFD